MHARPQDRRQRPRAGRAQRRVEVVQHVDARALGLAAARDRRAVERDVVGDPGREDDRGERAGGQWRRRRREPAAAPRAHHGDGAERHRRTRPRRPARAPAGREAARRPPRGAASSCSHRSSSSTQAVSRTSARPVSSPLWNRRNTLTEPPTAIEHRGRRDRAFPAVAARQRARLQRQQRDEPQPQQRREQLGEAQPGDPVAARGRVERHVDRRPQRLEAVRRDLAVGGDAAADRRLARDGEHVVGVLGRQRARQLVAGRHVHPQRRRERDRQREQHDGAAQRPRGGASQADATSARRGPAALRPPPGRRCPGRRSRGPGDRAAASRRPSTAPRPRRWT